MIGQCGSHDQRGHSLLTTAGSLPGLKSQGGRHWEDREHTVQFYILRPPQGYSLSPRGSPPLIVFKARRQSTILLSSRTRVQQRNKISRIVTAAQLVPHHLPQEECGNALSVSRTLSSTQLKYISLLHLFMNCQMNVKVKCASSNNRAFNISIINNY